MLKLFSKIVKATLLLFILITIIVQIPIIQNFIIDKITVEISERTGMELSINNFYLSPFSGMTLSGLELIDERSPQPLAIINEFSIPLRKSLFSILNNEFYINDITIKNAEINLYRGVDDSELNIIRFINELNNKKNHEKQNIESPNEEESAFSPFIDLRELTLEMVRVSIEDKVNKMSINASLDQGQIEIISLIPDQNEYNIKNIRLVKPDFEMVYHSQKDKERTESNVDNNTLNNIEEDLLCYLEVNINDISIEKGRIKLNDNPERSNNTEKFDWKNFEITNLNVGISDFTYQEEQDLLAQINDVRFNLDNIINLEFFKANAFVLTRKFIELEAVLVRTKKSTVSEYIRLEYEKGDLVDNLSKSFLTGHFKKLDISLDEFAYFFPVIKQHKSYHLLANEVVEMKGDIKGSLKKLRAQNIEIKLRNILDFEGNVSARNLNVSNEELLNISITNLSTSMRGLRVLIPNLRIPRTFDQLGRLSFNGRYDGFFLDFASYGDIRTDVGRGKIDMRLDLKSGMDNASYSGHLELIDFDLKKWSQNPNLGRLNAVADVKEGHGLTFEHASAVMDANILNIDYKDYHYENIEISGSLDKNRFKGELDISDDNIDFTFNGLVEFTDSLPQYNFEMDITYLDFKELNLTKEEYSLTGDVVIDMQGKNLRSVVGTLDTKNMQLYKGDELFDIDSIQIESRFLGNSGMGFYLESKYVNAETEGLFDLADIPTLIANLIKEKTPTIFKKGQSSFKSLHDLNQKYKFDIEIKDSHNLFALWGQPDLRLTDVIMTGNVDIPNDLFNVFLNTPLLTYGGNDFINVTTTIASDDYTGGIEIFVDSIGLGKVMLEQVHFSTAIYNDTIAFSVNSDEVIDTISEIHFDGMFIPNGNVYDLKLLTNSVNLLGEIWTINPANRMTIGKEHIAFNDFILTDGDRKIVLSDINNKSLEINLKEFDFSLVNLLINFSQMHFSGIGQADIKVLDVFHEKTILVDMDIPDFHINNDDYGRLYFNISQEEDKNILDLDLSIKNDLHDLMAKGNINIKTKEIYVDYSAHDIPLAILEYIITEGISETKGNVNLKAVMQGVIPDIKFHGTGKVKGGQVKVDFLGTSFKLGTETVTVTEKYMDFTGAKVYDVNGNEGDVIGGIEHRLFRDYRMDLSMNSNDFEVLNTTEDDNPVFYGLGRGAVSVSFSGPFEAANIKVDAKVEKDSYIVVPIRLAQYDYDESFIKFSKPEKIDTSLSIQEEFKLLGLDYQMNLEVTEEAIVSLIFDESVGDIMTGSGVGDISMYIGRSGEFEVFGDYEIQSGEYLFTLGGVAAKPFRVKRGGLVKWTGDPFDASLNVEAYYENLRAPLNVFLDSYLESASPAAISDAKNRTQIDLQLNLTGTLYKPIINFNIGIPNVTGELKSYVQSKMRTLETTPNAINNQVVGLLVFRTFLPDNNPLSSVNGSNLALTSSNTITEFITSQLSLLISDIIDDQLDEDSFLQGVDLDFGLTNNDVFATDIKTGISFDELDFNSKYRFKNDNFVLNAGINYVWGEAQAGVNNYLVGDIGIDWFLTEDKRLKFRFYSHTDYDELLIGRRFKNGVGLSYRKKFGYFSTFQKQKAQAKSIQEGN